MIRLGERARTVVDRTHFERIVAKAILFRTTERIVQRQNFGGYRANIVTYTLALLSNATSQRIDLDRIWREQTLSQNLQDAIAELSHDVYKIVTNPPTARNITEWCKAERCWEIVRTSVSRAPIERIGNELLNTEATRREQKRSMAGVSSDHVENLRRLVEVNSEGWKMLADWGAGTASMDPAQRQLTLHIGRALQRGNSIAPADAARAVEILDRATALGFGVESNGMGSTGD